MSRLFSAVTVPAYASLTAVRYLPVHPLVEGFFEGSRAGSRALLESGCDQLSTTPVRGVDVVLSSRRPGSQAACLELGLDPRDDLVEHRVERRCRFVAEDL